MVVTDEGYELRCDDVPVATIGNPAFKAEVACATRDGSWTFARLRGGNTEARLGTATIASYRSGFLPGGRVALPDGLELRLRPPAVGQTWRVRRGMMSAVIAFRAT